MNGGRGSQIFSKVGPTLKGESVSPNYISASAWRDGCFPGAHSFMNIWLEVGGPLDEES